MPNGSVGLLNVRRGLFRAQGAVYAGSTGGGGRGQSAAPHVHLYRVEQPCQPPRQLVTDGAGIRKGDRVAILAYNGVEYLDTFFACGKLGAVLVALNWRLHWRELLQLIEKTAPDVLIYSDEFKEMIAEISAHDTSIKHLLHIEGRGLPNSRSFEKTLSDSELRPVTTDDVREEDIACLIFTGGRPGCRKPRRSATG